MKIKESSVLLNFLTVGTILIVSLSFSCSRRKSPYLISEISGPISVNSEWQEINFSIPYKPEKKIQEICINFSEPVQNVDYIWIPKLSNGQFVSFEIKTIDEKGNLFDFNRVSLLNENEMCFRATAENSWDNILPRDRKYQTVKIKSSQPINLSKIYWNQYNQEERK